MNKKVYQKPSIKAVALSQKVQLLNDSAVQASRSSYGEAITQEWDSE